MDKISTQYIQGLQKAYYQNNAKDHWDHFAHIKHGASKAQLEQLKQIYPDIPRSLLDLLEYVDGTYWRKYQDEEIIFYFLGSDVTEYPYYLLSTQEMIENQNEAYRHYADYIERKYDDVDIDEKITNTATHLKWLHFSDCMNNGGTSQLFIDFSPSEQGKIGQIVRFLHDPDELTVIADHFDDYLKLLIHDEFNFINEDSVE